ncbi:MAG: hypothetical protein OSJ26_02665, partial [Muribaculaceae bacterium]|nr:hypothetical protein [Muribaculaceae bacterium]
ENVFQALVLLHFGFETTHFFNSTLSLPISSHWLFPFLPVDSIYFATIPIKGMTIRLMGYKNYP